MAKKRKWKPILEWWAFVIIGVILFRFLGPWMVSIKDTAVVVLGIILLVSYFVWAYYMFKPWVIKAFKYLGEE